jgi:hypothetical protein
MKRVTRLALIILASVILPGHLCNADDGTVTGDTRYKYSRTDNVFEKTSQKVQVASTKEAVKNRRGPRRWQRVGAHWYYARAGEIPWWPNAPGD